MANPSILNGHIDVANELAEQFAKAPITGQEWRVLWVVMRETWGYKSGDRKRDFHPVSSRHIERQTGMKRANVMRVIVSLMEKSILLRTEEGYGINQDYHRWVVVKRLPRLLTTVGSPLATTDGSQWTTENGSQQATPSKIKERQKDNIASPPRRGGGARPLQEYLEPLAVFTVCMKPAFDNPEQLDTWINRYRRASKAIKGFTPRQIATACIYARYERDEYQKRTGQPYDVHLETVAKKIFEHKDDEPGGKYEQAVRMAVAFYDQKKDQILSKNSPFLPKSDE